MLSTRVGRDQINLPFSSDSDNCTTNYSGVDVDKWDYLKRDDLYMNVGTIFQADRFMESCRVEKVGARQRRRIILRDHEVGMLKV